MKKYALLILSLVGGCAAESSAPLSSTSSVVFDATTHCQPAPFGDFWNCAAAKVEWPLPALTGTEDPLLKLVPRQVSLRYTFTCDTRQPLTASLYLPASEQDLVASLSSSAQPLEKEVQFTVNPHDPVVILQMQQPSQTNVVHQGCRLSLRAPIVFPQLSVVRVIASARIQESERVLAAFRATGSTASLQLELNRTISMLSDVLDEKIVQWAQSETDARNLACQQIGNLFAAVGRTTADGTPVFSGDAVFLPETLLSELTHSCLTGGQRQPGRLITLASSLSQCETDAASCTEQVAAARVALQKNVEEQLAVLDTTLAWLRQEYTRVGQIASEARAELEDLLRIVSETIEHNRIQP